MTTDASDTAVAVSLFRVQQADATPVTAEDLKDNTITRLVGVTCKKLDERKTRWHTFETELYAIVLVVEIFGAFITTATMTYPQSAVKKDRYLE